MLNKLLDLADKRSIYPCKREQNTKMYLEIAYGNSFIKHDCLLTEAVGEVRQHDLLTKDFLHWEAPSTRLSTRTK